MEGEIERERERELEVARSDINQKTLCTKGVQNARAHSHTEKLPQPHASGMARRSGNEEKVQVRISALKGKREYARPSSSWLSRRQMAVVEVRARAKGGIGERKKE
jgi:hypothetical protein